MSRDDLQYFEIADFTPGIHQLASPAMPPGAADADSTFGCYASARRGLTGLPGRDWAYTPVAPDPGANRAQINGFLVAPAAQSISGVDVSSGLGVDRRVVPKADDLDATGPYHSVMFYVAYEWVDTTPVRVAHLILAAVNVNSVAPPETVLQSTSGGPAVGVTDVMRTWITLTRSVGDVTAPGARPATDTGTPVVVANHIGPNLSNEAGDTSRYFVMTPNPTNLPNLASPSILDMAAYFATGFGGRLLAHQGRILTAPTIYYGRYGDSTRVGTDAGFVENGVFEWTQANAVNFDFRQSFMDRPYSFGDWASLTASDLLIITHADGAFLIQGDLNAPIVRRFPGVVGTRGLECSGTPSSAGYIYGVGAGGVYLWQGDDSSKLLSPQLNDEFWVSSTMSKHRNHKGTFANWGNWILVPNGWMLDLDTGSWWQIDADPNNPNYRPITNWQTSPNGAYAYGTPAYMDRVAGVNQPSVYGFKRNAKRSSWTWKSWPLFQRDHRRVQIKEIELTTQCTVDSQIVVTVSSSPLDNGSSVSRTFNCLSSDKGQTRRHLIDYKCRNPRITIQSNTGDAEILAIRLGYVRAEELPAETN